MKSALPVYIRLWPRFGLRLKCNQSPPLCRENKAAFSTKQILDRLIPGEFEGQFFIFRQLVGIRLYYKSSRLCPDLLGLQAAGHMTLACKDLGVLGS